MILRSAPASPFGRKTKMSAIMLGLMDRIEVVRANLMDPEETVPQQNPLGKIPVLILDDGTELFDSPVICEYLDSIGDGTLFPSGSARWGALRMQALCDGILDAGILQVYETRYRPENMYHQPWVDMQQAKIDRAMGWLEANAPNFGAEIDIGDVHAGLRRRLGYLDFRFEGTWRKGSPQAGRLARRLRGSRSGLRQDHAE